MDSEILVFSRWYLVFSEEIKYREEIWERKENKSQKSGARIKKRGAKSIYLFSPVRLASRMSIDI